MSITEKHNRLKKSIICQGLSRSASSRDALLIVMIIDAKSAYLMIPIMQTNTSY